MVEDDGTSSQSDHLDELEGEGDGNSGTLLCVTRRVSDWLLESVVDDSDSYKDGFHV